MRVVTTLPSATELVAALGIDPVGVSHECDYPPHFASRPSVTRSRIDADASTDEIDRQVREASVGGGDDGAADGGVFDVDVETIERLDPDVIVTQGVCDVCAVDTAAVADAVEGIDAEPELVTIDAHTIDEVFDDLERLGRVLGREDRARDVRSDLDARLDALRERAPADPDARPRVAIFDWTDPLMVAAHWVPELVEIAGGRYALASSGERARPREWAEIRDYDPEVVVVAPCGYDLAQTAANLADLTDRAGWRDLAAVDAGRAWAMDGHHYLNRPGPRLVDAAEALAAMLQPEATADAVDADRRRSGAYGSRRDSESVRVDGDEARPVADVAVPLSELESRPPS
ncbi:ABC transporter substrate-binding protein [Halovivax limisalsi]|uniref:ABC transporter substrate-binding protein n=1 Tax=Halovivax limisalsi TaxID=1453760 RepID=UPI001FFCAA5F|nr:ABC transporter substrate-binding protein [Halovivax limisalsi]